MQRQACGCPLRQIIGAILGLGEQRLKPKIRTGPGGWAFSCSICSTSLVDHFHASKLALDLFSGSFLPHQLALDQIKLHGQRRGFDPSGPPTLGEEKRRTKQHRSQRSAV